MTHDFGQFICKKTELGVKDKKNSIRHCFLNGYGGWEQGQMGYGRK